MDNIRQIAGLWAYGPSFSDETRSIDFTKPQNMSDTIYATDIPITDGNFTPTNALGVLQRYKEKFECEPFRLLHTIGTYDVLYLQNVRLDKTLQALGAAVVQSELVVVSLWSDPSYIPAVADDTKNHLSMMRIPLGARLVPRISIVTTPPRSSKGDGQDHRTVVEMRLNCRLPS